MDYVFWTGLALGAILGLVGSILGNLWTDAIREYLDKRRRIKLSNKRSKEVRTYFYVRALAEGNPTATLLLDISQNDCTRGTIFMALCLIMVLPMLFVAREPLVKQHLGLFFTAIGALSLCFLFFYFYTTSMHWQALRIKYRLQRFQEYETSIRVKWGDDALEDFLTAAQLPPGQ